MAFENEEKKLHDALVSCKVPDIAKAVDEAHAAGMSATAIIDCLGNSMSEVGVLFERGKLFLPHVLSAANGMKKAMDDLGPELAAGGETGEAKASVVMGTVEGDVHDIGKSICSTMLQCAGFDVHDLGRDVPKGNFINEVQNGCTFCGMSALMTTTMTVQKDVIEMLKEAGLRSRCSKRPDSGTRSPSWSEEPPSHRPTPTRSEQTSTESPLPRPPGRPKT